jgi:putative serine protease PepD
MTQTTDPGNDHWRGPWASPAPADTARQAAASSDDAGRAAAAAQPQHPAPADTAVAGHPQAGAPGDPNVHSANATQQLPQAWPPPPPPPATGYQSYPPPPAHERRRPTWAGVAVLGAATALVASLLTAGGMTLLDDDTAGPSASISSSAPAQQTAPLVPTDGSSLPNWGSVASAVEPSVVSVRVDAGNGSGGEGSGVILDAKGRILTNNHVVADAGSGATISVVLSDGRSYPVTITGTDPSTDLAVLQFKTVPSGLKPATFGDSNVVKVGDPVMAVGNPLGLSDTVTTGIVSALNRPVSTEASTAPDESNPFGQPAQSEAVVTLAIQTDAAVNPGNSGGALVDSGGRVIGITSSIASLGSSGGQAGSIGLGFAIPVTVAKDVADQIINNGTVQHAYLGVTLGNDTVKVGDAERQAAVIGSVSEGTPAAKAGLLAKDAIIAINGRPIDGANSLVGTVRALRPGTQVKLSVVRGDKTQEITVTLATKPASTNG